MSNLNASATGRVLPDLSQLSREQLIAMVEAARKQQTSRLTLKVSPKGCVSIYGMVIRGHHLYAEHLLRLFENQDMIKAWIENHKRELSWKADAE